MDSDTYLIPLTFGKSGYSVHPLDGQPDTTIDVLEINPHELNSDGEGEIGPLNGQVVEIEAVDSRPHCDDGLEIELNHGNSTLSVINTVKPEVIDLTVSANKDSFEVIRSSDVISNEVINSEIISSDVISREVINSEITSSDVIKSEVTRRDVISSEVTSKDVISSKVISSDVINSEVISNNVISREVISSQFIDAEATQHVDHDDGQEDDCDEDNESLEEEIVQQTIYLDDTSDNLVLVPVPAEDKKGVESAILHRPMKEQDTYSVIKAGLYNIYFCFFLYY